LDEEKSKHAGLAQQTGCGPAFFPQDAEAGKRHRSAEHLLLIGYSPGGLPLVGSHLFVLSVLVL